MNNSFTHSIPSPDAPTTRLNKAIAQAGLCSRRAADALVQQGRVSIDGQTVTEPGTQVDLRRQNIAVDGKKLDFAAKTTENGDPRLYYLMLNKPVHVVSTSKDPEGRTTVLQCLPERYASVRLFPVGRLDYFSEGMLLLTNDGELTQRLTHPRYHLPKVYHVQLRETPDEAALETMRHGMTLAEGERLAPVEARLIAENPVTIEMTLHQGVNRQIRRMCRDLGLTILRLQRIQSGPIHLGELPSGSVRELNAIEVTSLKQAVGLAPPSERRK